MEGSPGTRQPAFQALAASYGVNQVGDQLGLVALAILVLDHTHSALATAALFCAMKFVPAFVAPALTARLDRLPSRGTLPALYGLEALIFCALALSATHFALAVVLALAFADGVLALTARGLSRAAIAGVLGPDLRAGNAVLNVIFAVSIAAGPALGGILVATAGTSTALLVDGASFAAVALILAACRTLPARIEGTGRQSWRARVREGVAYIRARPLLRTLVGLEGVAIIFFTLIIPIEVVYAKETLEVGNAGFGALLAAWGVGMVIGSAAFTRLTHRSIVVLVVSSTLLVGVGYLGLAISPGIVAACAASILGGMGNGVQWVAVITAVQENVADDFQARVVGLLESVSAATPGVGYVVGGVLAAVWSPRLAYLVAGLGVVIIAAAMTRRLGAGLAR